MNLYWVYIDSERGCSYGYFVFAESRNRAKALCVHRCTDDEEYTDFRSTLLGKNIGEKEMVVESPLDEDYRFVMQCGYEFQDDKDD